MESGPDLGKTWDIKLKPPGESVWILPVFAFCDMNSNRLCDSPALGQKETIFSRERHSPEWHFEQANHILNVGTRSLRCASLESGVPDGNSDTGSKLCAGNIKNILGLKARFIPAWGNAPGKFKTQI